jgi:hypothetical protein
VHDHFFNEIETDSENQVNVTGFSTIHKFYGCYNDLVRQCSLPLGHGVLCVNYQWLSRSLHPNFDFRLFRLLDLEIELIWQV